MSDRDGAEKPRHSKHLRAMVATALAAAVPLLGVSLGVSAAPTPDGAGPAAGARSAAAGEKLAQSKQLKLFKQRPVESKQLKLFKQRKARKVRRSP